MSSPHSNSSSKSPKTEKSREAFVNLVRNILREETQKLSCHNRLTDQYPEGKWLEVVIEEAGERCIDEKDLFRTLSNSKQSVGGESNRATMKSIKFLVSSNLIG